MEKKQLSAKKAETKKIANVHVEHVIGNLKKRFAILSQGSLPINLVKGKSNEVMDATPNIDKLVTVSRATERIYGPRVMR